LPETSIGNRPVAAGTDSPEWLCEESVCRLTNRSANLQSQYIDMKLRPLDQVVKMPAQPFWFLDTLASTNKEIGVTLHFSRNRVRQVQIQRHSFRGRFFDQLESRIFLSVSPSPGVIAADTAAIAADTTNIATDKASIKQNLASVQSDFNTNVAANDLSNIADVQQQLAADQNPANGNNDPGTLAQDRQAVAAAKNQYKDDQTALASEEAGATLQGKETLAADNLVLSDDKQQLALDKKGKGTPTVDADIAALEFDAQTIEADQIANSQQAVSDASAFDSGTLPNDQQTIAQDQAQLASDKNPANGNNDPGTIAEDKQQFVADQLTLKQDQTAIAVLVKQDLAAPPLTTDTATLKHDQKTLAADLRSHV
jgi:hypothetical protein